MQQELDELLGGVGEGKALARAAVELVGDGVELGFGGSPSSRDHEETWLTKAPRAEKSFTFSRCSLSAIH